MGLARHVNLKIIENKMIKKILQLLKTMANDPTPVKKGIHRIGLVIGILTVGFACLFSCKKNKMYQEYESYGKGYEAAQEGQSKPSIWANKVEENGYKQGIKDLQSEHTGPSCIGFKYTEKEIKSLQNKWSSFEEMLNAAMNGNSEAMFSIGLCYLYSGKGLPIDIERANMFFSNAASLGHAPSLEKIRVMCLEDDPNPFIHQVYLNLIIAMGHTEYTQEYHRIRNEWVKKFDKIGGNGNAVVKEIEMRAETKLMQIYENIETLDSAKKEHDTKLFISKINDITVLDKRYGMDYWFSVAGIPLE